MSSGMSDPFSVRIWRELMPFAGWQRSRDFLAAQPNPPARCPPLPVRVASCPISLAFFVKIGADEVTIREKPAPSRVWSEGKTSGNPTRLPRSEADFGVSTRHVSLGHVPHVTHSGYLRVRRTMIFPFVLIITTEGYDFTIPDPSFDHFTKMGPIKLYKVHFFLMHSLIIHKLHT